MSRTDLAALQLDKLRGLLLSAARHCPWHAARIRAAGLPVDEALLDCELTDFERLPPTSKETLRGPPAGSYWAGAPGGAQRYNTGGSSGEPLIFYFGRARQASDAAGRMRARRWWGVEVGAREVYLWGAPAELNRTDQLKTFRDRLINHLVLDAFAMSPERMARYAHAISAFRPHCVYGYASSLALLAAYVRDRKIKMRLPELKVVCTTGEPLYPFQRQLIEEVFGAPAANEFGSRDIGFTAHEAPNGSLLLMSESVLLEVLDDDGKPVRTGELGEAVMTGLCSHVQPFLRYRTGDMVRLSEIESDDGRGLHVLSEVVGRNTDFMVRPDGTLMHALAAIYVLRDTPGITQFKLVQHQAEDLEVLVVRGDGWSRASEDTVKQGLGARFGPDVHVRLSYVDDIPPAVSGKYRYVESLASREGATGDLVRTASARSA